MSNATGRYDAERRVTLAERPGLRVRELALAAGQRVPWHHHTQITERFFCLTGPMQVLTRDPDAAHVLAAGETCTVAPGTPHRVSGVDDGPCSFISVQGVGEYDFVPLDGDG